LESEALAYKIANLALEKKGKQIVVMHLHHVTTISDFFVIISADSETQVKALSDHILRQLKNEKIKVYHREGYESLRWVLLDYVDVVVHIFRNETRGYYGLERLWGDAKIDMVMDAQHES
jgi:ribosome-associated protein